MGWSPIVVDPLTWPPTPVTRATLVLSMERLPGLVRMMECGVGQIQFVSVSEIYLRFFM